MDKSQLEYIGRRGSRHSGHSDCARAAIPVRCKGHPGLGSGSDLSIGEVESVAFAQLHVRELADEAVGSGVGTAEDELAGESRVEVGHEGLGEVDALHRGVGLEGEDVVVLHSLADVLADGEVEGEERGREEVESEGNCWHGRLLHSGERVDEGEGEGVGRGLGESDLDELRGVVEEGEEELVGTERSERGPEEVAAESVG